jgi:hypothetical protein
MSAHFCLRTVAAKVGRCLALVDLVKHVYKLVGDFVGSGVSPLRSGCPCHQMQERHLQCTLNFPLAVFSILDD